MARPPFFSRFLALALVLAWLPATAGAGVTETAKDFTAEGKNRAVIQIERAVFADRLDVSGLLGTLSKAGEMFKTPAEPHFLYQDVDPVPLESYKIYTPWLNHFKEAMVFVLGRLNPGRLKLASWSVSLHAPTGRIVRAFSGVGAPPNAFAWNARDADFNPVGIEQGYVPEITLTDLYGAKVTLPQKQFYLDQFLWQDSNRLTAAFRQDSVFEKNQAQFSENGGMIMRELSNLVNQHDGLALRLECSGPDTDLNQERGFILRAYFARENLRLRKIEVKNLTRPGEAVVTVAVLKRVDR